MNGTDTEPSSTRRGGDVAELEQREETQQEETEKKTYHQTSGEENDVERDISARQRFLINLLIQTIVYLLLLYDQIPNSQKYTLELVVDSRSRYEHILLVRCI